MGYIGRLAPSPTGYLHLGHAATFLAAAERAVRGRLLLRMDDLDAQRSKPAFAEAAKEDLRWLGLHWEGEYRQAERLALYRAAMEKLVQRGLAYPCTCTRKDLQAATQAPHEDADDEPVYNGRCRPKPPFSTPPPDGDADLLPAAGMPLPTFAADTNYRFRVSDDATVTFVDGACGPQRFTAGVDFGDFLVWRKDGLPSYQLATVVDEADMGITEVVRGRDLLKSTARQILVQRALRLPTPAYFHTALLRDAGGQRLAKRHDALSLRALRASGITAAEIRARVEDSLHQTKA